MLKLIQPLRNSTVILLILPLLTLTACSFWGEETPVPTPIRIIVTDTPISMVETSPPQPEAGRPKLPPTVTPTPLPATEIPPTPTATAMMMPPATSENGVIWRAGPGLSYMALGQLNAGTEFGIMGRTADSGWLLVQVDEQRGWLEADSGLIAVDINQLSQLPIVDVTEGRVSTPATAMPALVEALLKEIPLVVYHGGQHTCASHSGLQNLLPEVVPSHIIGPHAGDFVLDNSHNVLFEYTGDGFRLLHENPSARFANDEKYLSFEEALSLFAEGRIVWTGHLGQFPGRGVTGCDTNN